MPRPPSREILVPFQIGPEGGIAYTNDRVKQASQYILSVVATNPGERVMRPTYGVPLTRMVFEPDSAMVQADIISRMEAALNNWAQGVEIVEIEPTSPTFSDGLLSFFISFRLPGSTDINTATISVGGTVTEIRMSV
jgi:phage baseplate assembly protein W